jgi:signal transduction histidine kinase
MLNQSTRRDEIGDLESGLNEMIEQLAALRVRHEMQSYELGKTQSAIGVVHNVGNGLSPLRVLLSRLNEELNPAVQTEMTRALAELAADDIPPERRKRMVAFVQAVVQQHNEQLGMGRDKVSEAGRSLSHVLDIIDLEKRNSSGKAEFEKCDINLLLQTNISLARSAVNFSLNYEFIPFAHPHVLANRILLSQVIANLLINAAESICSTGRGDGQINIRQALVETEQGTMHQLTIADNGDGFGEEVKAKLFTRGFSTRMEKSGGNGLHWCHNTVNAMHGTLTVISEGYGKGAYSVLKTPVFNMTQNEDSIYLRSLKDS